MHSSRCITENITFFKLCKKWDAATERRNKFIEVLSEEIVVVLWVRKNDKFTIFCFGRLCERRHTYFVEFQNKRVVTTVTIRQRKDLLTLLEKVFEEIKLQF